MKKITIIQLITFLNSILIYNSIFYEVTTDIYNKEFTNLDSYIKHIFVIPVNNMDDDIYYGFKINKITQDVFQDIEALHYETDYDADYTFYTTIKLNVESRKINEDSGINFKTHRDNYKVRYLGISIVFRRYIQSLTLSITTNNEIDLEYEKINIKNLYALIPYYYYIYIEGNNKFSIDIDTNYMTYFPFENFNITTEYKGYKQKEKLKENTIHANFIRYSNRYQLSIPYELELTNKENMLCFTFIPDYYIEDFKISVSGHYEKPDDGSDKILGLTKVVFSIIISISGIVIIAIVVVIIICLKKRKKAEEKTNVDNELPLFKDSKN